METETPFWENKIKKNITNLKRFIGKNCLISFYHKIVFPSSGNYGDYYIQGTIQDIDDSFLFIKFVYKKKNYVSSIDINDISGITAEE